MSIQHNTNGHHFLIDEDALAPGAPLVIDRVCQSDLVPDIYQDRDPVVVIDGTYFNWEGVDRLKAIIAKAEKLWR